MGYKIIDKKTVAYGVVLKFDTPLARALIGAEEEEGERWILDKQYVDFTNLHKTLKKNYSSLFKENKKELELVASSAGLFGNAHDTTFLKKRVQAVNTWIRHVIQFSKLIEDDAFRLIFLRQSDVKSKEGMQQYVARKKNEEEKQLFAEKKRSDKEEEEKRRVKEAHTLAEKKRSDEEEEERRRIEEEEKKGAEEEEERKSPMYGGLGLKIVRRYEGEAGSNRDGKTLYDIELMIETRRERELIGVPMETVSCRWLISKSYSQFAKLHSSVVKELRKNKDAKVIETMTKTVLPPKGGKFLLRSISRVFKHQAAGTLGDACALEREQRHCRVAGFHFFFNIRLRSPRESSRLECQMLARIQRKRRERRSQGS